jgi:glycosyltransferase involved in cell wall biosynthesis
MHQRIVVATPEPVGARMAGPAVRAWHLAEVLAAEHEVVLASTMAADVDHPPFKTLVADEPQFRQLGTWMDVLVVQSGLLHTYPFLAESEKPIVADVYIPFHLENLEQTSGMAAEEADAVVARLTSVLNQELARGDFFLCAGGRQRDFWLGSLAALGRANPYTYGDDPSLRRLIDDVPFGLPADPPIRRGHGLRGTVPGIGRDDKVIIWAGGVYNWFDPGSLVISIDQLRAHIPNVRLYFLGMQHPNPHIPAMRVATDVRALSAKLGLTDRHVFFNESWVDYERRADYLLDADLGVSTHLEHVETAFSFRTRIMDYLWAGLPMVVTEGDSLADLVQTEGLGRTVPPLDPPAIAAALLEALCDPPPKEAFRRVAERYTWERVAGPLLAFCRSPHRAPDLVGRAPSDGGAGASQPKVRQRVGQGWTTLQADGVVATSRRAAHYIRQAATSKRSRGGRAER